MDPYAPRAHLKKAELAEKTNRTNSVSEDPMSSNSGKLEPLFGILSIKYAFSISLILLFAAFHWPVRWCFSGSPILTFVLLLGAENGTRVLQFIPLWLMISVIQISYVLAATSWLFYWIFVAACYPTIGFVCLYQFETASRFARHQLRRILRELKFTKDVIAFFDLPALEIDVDVEGLMVIRGFTFSISSLTVIAHGVEVGVKFSDDLEVAFVVDTVTVKLFRRVDISDVFASVKGGEYEMAFRELGPRSKDDTGHSLMTKDTPLLLAAHKAVRKPSDDPKVAMTDEMTDGHAPENVSVKDALKKTKRIYADDQEAATDYHKMLKQIEETSPITIATREAYERLAAKEDSPEPTVAEDENNMRAAICARLQNVPTIPHPPKRSVRVSTLKTLDGYNIRKQLHRFPMLLRAQLQIISYFHPVFCSSITAGGSGEWIQAQLATHIFKNRPEDDSAVKNLRKRMSAWVEDANFVFETTQFAGVGYVPFNTQYDILSTLTFDDIMVYRTVSKSADIDRIVRVGGADARVTIPTYLLPHHEHLLPAAPTAADKKAKQREVDEADDGPKTVQAEFELNQTVEDETSMMVSAHLRLPTFFDQQLLDFIAALVKATKLIEIESDGPSLDSVDWKVWHHLKRHSTASSNGSIASDAESEDGVDPPDAPTHSSPTKTITGFRGISKALRTEMKTGIQRAAVDVAANDRWIAKLVGKVTKKLETMRGDLGYTGDVPIKLKVYRDQAESLGKILP